MSKTYSFDLLKDGLTQSQIQNYLKCKRYFFLSLVRGWSEARLSESLIFGILFHNWLEFVYKNLDQAIDTKDAIEEVLEAYASENDAEDWPLDVRQEWEIIAAKLRAVAPAYWDWWAKEDAKFQWRELEEVFKIFVPVTLRTGKVVDVPLTGKRDGLIQVSKKLALFETKTKGRINIGGLSNTVSNDFQVNFYLWVLRQQKLPTNQFVYNIIHNPSLRLGAKESIDEFQERISKDIAKNPADYFIRMEKTVSDKQLDTFGEIVMGLVTEIANFILIDKAQSEDRFTAPCLGPYGQCELLGMCYHGDSAGLKRRDVVHPELELSI